MAGQAAKVMARELSILGLETLLYTAWSNGGAPQASEEGSRPVTGSADRHP